MGVYTGLEIYRELGTLPGGSSYVCLNAGVVRIKK